jgi:hypothetical protein
MDPIFEDGLLVSRDIQIIAFPGRLVVDQFPPFDQIIILILLVFGMVDDPLDLTF